MLTEPSTVPSSFCRRETDTSTRRSRPIEGALRQFATPPTIAGNHGGDVVDVRALCRVEHGQQFDDVMPERVLGRDAVKLLGGRVGERHLAIRVGGNDRIGYMLEYPPKVLLAPAQGCHRCHGHQGWVRRVSGGPTTYQLPPN